MLVQRIQKRTADKYLSNPADMGEVKVVNAKMDQALLAAEGFEVFARKTNNDNEYRANDGQLYRINSRGEVEQVIKQPAPTPPPAPVADEPTYNDMTAEQAIAELSRDDLKRLADDMGIEYPKNISTKRLVKLVQDA